MSAETIQNFPSPPDFPPPPPPPARSRKRQRTQDESSHTQSKKAIVGDSSDGEANYVVYGSEGEDEMGKHQVTNHIEASSSKNIEESRPQRKKARPTGTKIGAESESNIDSESASEGTENSNEHEQGSEAASQSERTRRSRRTSQSWRKDIYKPPSSDPESDSELDLANFEPRPGRGSICKDKSLKSDSVSSKKLQKSISSARRAKSTPDLKATKAPIRVKTRMSKFIEGSMGDRTSRAVPPLKNFKPIDDITQSKTENGIPEDIRFTQLQDASCSGKPLDGFDFTDANDNKLLPPSDSKYDTALLSKSKFTFTSMFTPLFSSLKLAWHAARTELEEKEREKERHKEESRRLKLLKARGEEAYAALKESKAIKQESIEDNDIGVALTHNHAIVNGTQGLPDQTYSVVPTINNMSTTRAFLPPSPPSFETDNFTERKPKKALTQYRQNVLTKRLVRLEHDLLATKAELLGASYVPEQTPVPSIEYSEDPIILSAAEDEGLYENTLVKNHEALENSGQSRSPSQSRVGSPRKRWLSGSKSRDRSTTPNTTGKSKKANADLLVSGRISKAPINARGRGSSVRGRGRSRKSTEA